MIIQCVKKPIIVNAIQIEKNSLKEVKQFLGKDYRGIVPKGGIQIQTLEGVMTAKLNDYILEGVEGEHWSVREDIFHKTYVIIEPD